jgi:DNA-3-methyladenine glycosylase I
MADFEIRALNPEDRNWITHLLTDRWGATIVISRGRSHHADQLSGFVAILDGRPAGLATFHVEGNVCELVSLDSLAEGMGIGTALIKKVRDAAVSSGCRRLWLATTNDNLPALHFYQKRGFILAALHPGALKLSRKLKPSIPLIGMDGIPLLDEIELELPLTIDD